MACGVVCVATKAGDSASIIGNSGVIIPPQRPDLLCRAWQSLLDAGPATRERLGNLARQRVQECFSLTQVAARYEAFYENVLCTPLHGAFRHAF